MIDTRKSIKITPTARAKLRDVRTELGVKTDNMALCYLLALYDETRKGMTVKQHKDLMSYADVIDRQFIL